MYNKIYNYLWIFAFLADLGLYTITIREITENKNKAKDIAGNVLTLRFFLGIIIMTLALWLAFFLPGYNSALALGGIAIVSLFTIVSLINSAIMAVMQSYMKIEFSLISTILGKIINISLIAGTVFYIYPLSGDLVPMQAFFYILGAGLIGIIVNTFLNIIYVSQSIFPPRFLYDREYITHIFKISLPYGLALFLGVVYFKIDIVLLSLLEWPQQWDISIAYYSLPMKIVEVLMVLWGFYLNSLLPSLSESYTQKNTSRFSQLLSFSVFLLLSWGLFILLSGTLLARQVIEIIANQDYIIGIGSQYSSLSVFPIVLCVLVFYFLSLVFTYWLIAAKKQGILLKINIIVTCINIIGNIIFIPHYSFMGAAYVTVLSQVCLCVLSFFALQRITHLHIKTTPIIWVFVLGFFVYVLWDRGLQYTDFSQIGDVLVWWVVLGTVYFWLLGLYILKNKKDFS